MARFQILSLIGGGIRGAFVTSLLYELEQKLGRRIAESFDLIAGTSTGGIIAASLAFGMSAEQVYHFYRDHGAKIFTPRPKYKAKGLMRPIFPMANWVFKRKTGGELDSAFRARFCPHALQAAFDIAYGDKTLKEIEFTRLIIPTVNLTRGEPHVFRSRHLPKGVHDQDVKISDVIIAATAAPTYFPHKQIGGNSYVDGGVWANDPSLLALAETVRIKNLAAQQKGEQQKDRHVHMDDIHMLSIGTGRSEFSLAPPGPDAGLLFWAPNVADVMGTAQTQGTHLPMKFILGEQYRHINFKMKQLWDLADVSKIPELFSIGTKCAEANYSMVSGNFFEHKRIPYTPFTSTENEANFFDEYSFE